MARKRTQPKRKSVEAFTHDGAKRRNIPTAEYQPVMDSDDQNPIRVAYERRNPDLDPQLVWRGKDMADWSDLVVQAPPLFIQEKVHPKVLIDDLARMSRKARAEKDAAEPGFQTDIFGDFNGLPDDDAKTEFYQHDANWSNRMILGDSLQVMASLAEREGLRGKVQCIYMDPPYGIKFNSNFQWSTTSRDVKDGKAEHITREPEQVKAFRDTWRDGIHSYLTYLRDRLTVARDLLTESGSIFVQIGDENVHRVRAVMDEVFGEGNFFSGMHYRALTPLGSRGLSNVYDHILWYAKDKAQVKYRNIQIARPMEEEPEFVFCDDGSGWYRRLDGVPENSQGVFKRSDLKSSGYTPTCVFDFSLDGQVVRPRGRKSWRTNRSGIENLIKANRLLTLGISTYFRQYFNDAPMRQMENTWTDTAAGFSDTKVYVVQTHTKIITRCVLMTTDPGDLTVDPTCGSGTTAYVAEQWGRRWITIDTSRVALALARSRVMGARYPYYLLADSSEGQRKEAELSRSAPSQTPTYDDIRQGFVYERVPHVTLKSIANNAEIDVIFERKQPEVEAALADINHALQGNAKPFKVETGGRKGEAINFTASEDATVALPSGESAPANGFLEWEVPREPDEGWNEAAHDAHARFWEARIARQREIDACIAARAEYETLYDKPFEDKAKTRVAGPFTVESLSPHRLAALDEDDELMIAEPRATYDAGASAPVQDFAHMVLENLRTAGVQQADKRGHIRFTSLNPWPGRLVCAEGWYAEGSDEKTAKEQRAGIFIGPEFGTVSRADLASAVREAAEAGFDALIACAFNYEARATEFNKLGRVPILKARMNADLHMAEDLKQTDKANLFVIFGEPDIDIEPATGPDGEVDWLKVKINGVDVFDPSTGEVRSDDADGIACWFVDSDYNEESFFVRQAYFLGAGDPYKSLKTTLKAEIDRDAWATLNSDTSRAFPKPSTGRIAVKVINHLGDEVMKVFGV